MNIELTGTKNGHGNILRTMDWENAEGQQLRVIMKNGEPWFCLKDVCSILSIENQGNVASRLDQRGIHQTDTLTSGGTQQLNYVDEPNLYRVIFRSDKPDAKKFQDWVFGTVLPSIRKTGSYLSQEDRRKVELWDYQNRGNIARAKLQYLITEKFGNMKNFAFMIRCSYSETRRTVSGYCYNERVCKAVKTWFGVDVQYEYTGKRMFEELESISQKIQSSRYLEGENG